MKPIEGEIRGYKVFMPGLTCRNKQYTCPGVFHEDEAEICVKGMHFCRKAVDCFRYYPFDPGCRVCEVIGRGMVDYGDPEEDSKVCVTDLEIVRELTWAEVLDIINIGYENIGRSNIGDSNSGDFNVGSGNKGDCNVGDRNGGSGNVGDRNGGSYNIGDGNGGFRNVGDCNDSSRNVGSYNTGNNNIGDLNTGGRNIGSENTGFQNIGRSNGGSGNVGFGNTGLYNVGDFNHGISNVGDFNTASHTVGCFNTEDGVFRMFDKPSPWTTAIWHASAAKFILSAMPNSRTEWIAESFMTSEDKRLHPFYKRVGGCLRVIRYTDADRQIWWDHELNDTQRRFVLDIPNFDADIFKKCTGIDVRKENLSEE